MYNMMSAADARYKAKGNIDERTKKGLTRAKKNIEDAVAEGNMSCWCYEYLTEKAVQYLTGLGYGVKNESNQKEGTLFKISW